MTAQARSTCSSVPWEQGDIKSSGSHDPPCLSQCPKNTGCPGAGCGLATPGRVAVSHEVGGLSSTRSHGTRQLSYGFICPLPHNPTTPHCRTRRVIRQDPLSSRTQRSLL